MVATAQHAPHWEVARGEELRFVNWAESFETRAITEQDVVALRHNGKVMLDSDPVWLSAQLWSLFSLVLTGDAIPKFNTCHA